MGDQISNKDLKSDVEVIDGIDIDLILAEELGQFGPYQLRVLAFSAIIVIVSSWASNQFVFTTARTNTRCLIPECESMDNVNFTASWILNALPGFSTSSFDNCQRFASSTNVSTKDVNEICPATLFDHDSVVSCDAFVYENTDTVVFDFDLACDEWRRSLIGSARTFGMLVSHPITGYVSDHFGRNRAMTISAFNTAWLGVVRYWANTYVGFTISQFVEAAFGFGSVACAYISALELVGSKYRVAAGATISTCFALGEVTIAFIAWAIPNWRYLTLALYIPQLLTITYFWLLSESARWYISKGLYDKSVKVLKDVARVNKKELSEKTLLTLSQTFENTRSKSIEVTKNNDEKQPWLIMLVFKHKPILIRCIVSPIWWITAMCVYYGLSINSVNMVGNKYLNYAAVSVVEIPGFWTAVLLMDRVGRKPVLIGSFWVCATCMLGFTFMPDGLYAISLTLYLIGKYSISTVMTSIYVYTAELYPTEYRHSLFAFSSMMGRLGSIAAPLTPALGAAVWENLPFVLFAGFATLSGLLVFITPETQGCKLPDTMEEAVRLGKAKRSR